MNKETFIDGDKTIINTDFYLHLLSCEEREKRLIKYLEKESKEVYRDGGVRQNIFRDILEKVRSGKYD